MICVVTRLLILQCGSSSGSLLRILLLRCSDDRASEHSGNRAGCVACRVRYPGNGGCVLQSSEVLMDKDPDPPKATTPWGKIPIKEEKKEEDNGKDAEIR